MNNYFEIATEIIRVTKNKLKKELTEQLPGKEEKYINDFLEILSSENDLYISLNKKYKSGQYLSEELVSGETVDVFNIKEYPLYKHQENAIKSISNNKNTVISTGTGSGKTESFLIPVVDYCLKNKDKKGVKAIIIYPMNALANDQKRRISEIVDKTSLKFAIFTGDTKSRNDINLDEVNEYQENQVSKNQILYREDIVKEQPDILITNYVMLDKILTNKKYLPLIANSKDTMKFIVLDEVHTYKGNKGAHLKFLLDRIRYTIRRDDIVNIACSATLAHNDDESTNINSNTSDLDEFLNPLFDSNEYNLVEAEYEELSEIDQSKIPRAIYEEIDLLRKELFKRSMSLSEIARFLTYNFEKKYTKREAFKLLRRSNDIIDFRTNLFIKTRKGKVKRCINCNKYHITEEKRCSNCNSMLFDVDANKFDVLVGYVKNKKLMPEYTSGAIRVGIVPINNDGNNEFRNNGSEEVYFYIKKEDLIFDKKCEAWIDVYKKQEDNDLKLINIEKPEVINIDDEERFKEILKIVLKYKNKEIKENYNKKILTFIDSRKDVSREKTMFNEYCIKDAFMETLKLVGGGDNYIGIEEVLTNVYKKIKSFIEDNKIGNLKNKLDVFDDFGVWLMDAIFNYHIVVEDVSEYKKGNEIEEQKMDLINFLISEKVIYTDKIKHDKPKYLKYSLKREKPINIVTTSQSALKGNEFRKISLSSRARNINKYLKTREKDIDKYNFEYLLKELKKDGYLKEFNIEVDNSNGEYVKAYSLRGDKVKVKIGESEYESLEEIIENTLFRSETHSAEVAKKEKEKIENEFQNGGIDVLFSTPTLEMGIDIGGLNMVFMKGVPPTPSNFAQRAGRAGRAADKTALIVTVCNEKSNHDEYYFKNAIEMIEGTINPPRFQKNNMPLAQKHMNALIYQEGFSEKEKIKDMLSKAFKTISKDEISDYIDNFNERNLSENINYVTLNYILSNKNTNSLYKNNIFPDYSFRNDEICVYDEKVLYLKEELKRDINLDEYKISSRDPEMAYREYIPGITTYMSGKAMKISDKSEYEEVGNSGRIYKRVYAKEDFGNSDVFNEEDFDKFVTSEHIYYKKESLNKNKVIRVFYKDNVDLNFTNIGQIKKDGIEKFHDYRGEFTSVQNLKRHALIIEWEPEILSFEKVISFVAILDSAIKKMYGLDNDEIKIIHHRDSNSDSKESGLIALYDSNGNKNIDLKKIASNLKEVINFGIKEAENCKCKSKAGCYLCIRSYNTNRYAGEINKFDGCAIGKYINGDCMLPTDIKEDFVNHGYYDVDIILDVRGDDITVEYDGKIIKNNKEVNEGQNETIFKLLLEAIKDIDEDYVRISTNLDYVVDAINGDNKIEKGEDQFIRFMFEGMKFEQLFAERRDK